MNVVLKVCSFCHNTGPLLRRCSIQGCSSYICSSLSNREGCNRSLETPLCIVHHPNPDSISINMNYMLNNERSTIFRSKTLSSSLFKTNDDIESLEKFITSHIERQILLDIPENERSQDQQELLLNFTKYTGKYRSFFFFNSII